MVQFDGKVKVTYVTANGYQGVELACGLQSNPWILWKRNGQDIDFANTNGMSVSVFYALHILQLKTSDLYKELIRSNVRNESPIMTNHYVPKNHVIIVVLS